MEIKGIKLNVKYEEKEEAKKAGAKWDFKRKVWYFPVCKDLIPVLKWLNTDVFIYADSEKRKEILQEDDYSNDLNDIQLFMEIREGYPCCRCGKGMDILQPFSKPPKNLQYTKTYEYYLTWNKPKSYADFANNLGIKMEYRSTSIVKTPYAVHICPHCGQVQGDFYIFEDKDCRLPVKKSFYVHYNNKQDKWEIKD
ncbi:DUF5710 domain-containing protein [Clostridium sp. Marseille-Q7071]